MLNLCSNSLNLPPISRFFFFKSSISSGSPTKPFTALTGNGVLNMGSSQMRSLRVTAAASNENTSSGANVVKKRKVVEHISLLKAKDSISDEEESNMLDYLYTSQYYMGGIIAISLGRVSEQCHENYTHAVYMRFQRKEDLAQFHKNSNYLDVVKKHVMPYCHGWIDVDFESEVEDDILPIFRKGEEFNYGVEFILLISFAESALGKPSEDALTSLETLVLEFPSLIVQSTQGWNFNQTNEEYTHCVVIRFRSFEAFQIFMDSTEYKNVRSSGHRAYVARFIDDTAIRALAESKDEQEDEGQQWWLQMLNCHDEREREQKMLKGSNRGSRTV
ncbi:Stress responsive alpha-beta barrel [Dillenia turbinata]|uniref:Stress responsive alpha-beta barrel n=1 Tax=Dillenia turbinata TaxID=194707 RepID=A0AAN8W7T6_9MAGN